MQYFFFKLIPPRPTFPADMTEAEAAVMREHAAYWGKEFEEHRVVAYGPVMDPKGTYGIAVVEAVDEAAAKAIAENDPAVKANAGFGFEMYQMPKAIARSSL